MSETVHYKGTASLVDRGEQAEITAKILLVEKGDEIDTYYSTAVEQLCDHYYKDYFYYPKTEALYEISYTEHDLDKEIIDAKYIGFDNSQIGFELRYYNGGACFTECLEEAIDKL